MSATSVQALEKLRGELLARAAKLETDIAAAKHRGTQEQAAILDALPKKLGVANMEAVAVMLRARIRGEFGSLAAGSVAPAPKRIRVSLTDEMRTQMDTLLREVMMPGYAGPHTSDSIGEQVGCSASTVANRRAQLKNQSATPPPSALADISAPSPAANVA